MKTTNRKKRGVALIFFMLVLGLILGFFMIVVNTGMLVYQKIRLQSAVDLAAYAGASVQASYLGNRMSGENSILGINAKIFKRYSQLVEEVAAVNVGAWPQMLPDVASCVALCAAASLANAQRVVSAYRAASHEMDEYRNQIQNILAQMPKSTRIAVEETLRLNIPDLKIDEEGFEAILGDTTNSAQEIIKASKEKSPSAKKKNAILTFTSSKGFYMTSAVASVPHSFTFYGPACFPLVTYPQATNWFCSVNGSGYPGQTGYGAAELAYAQSFVPMASGNKGTIDKIIGPGANALRLNFIQNPHKPDPFVLVSAEWNAPEGSFLNFENSLGAKGSLFPTPSKLVAISLAEPFGGSLYSAGRGVYGTRLQSIRKVLLDPRMASVRGDYPNMFEYLQGFGPMDASGRPIKSAEAVVKMFLH